MKKEEEAEEKAAAEARAATSEASDIPQRSLFAIVRTRRRAVSCGHHRGVLRFVSCHAVS